MRWAKPLAAGIIGCALFLTGGTLHAGDNTARGYEPVKTDTGLLAQPWYLQSFLELQNDLATAIEKGKRFAVVWAQKGCPYCERMHEQNYTIPAVADYVRKHFDVLQLNLHGERRVTDFDGEVLSENDLARKYGVTYTPTIQFFPADPAKAEGKPGHKAEIERVRGYMKPVPFLAVFKYVADKRYRELGLRAYLQEQARSDLKNAGFQPKAW